MSMIFTMDRLKWDDQLFETIKGRIEFAQTEGELTDERNPITGDERVAWTGFRLDPHSFVLFYEARPRVMWVDELWVHKLHRNVGLGKALMDHVAEIARSTGYHKVELGTQMTNTKARRLYERLDYDERNVGYALDLRPADPPIVMPISDSDELPF